MIPVNVPQIGFLSGLSISSPDSLMQPRGRGGVEGAVNEYTDSSHVRFQNGPVERIGGPIREKVQEPEPDRPSS